MMPHWRPSSWQPATIRWYSKPTTPLSNNVTSSLLGVQSRGVTVDNRCDNSPHTAGPALCINEEAVPARSRETAELNLNVGQ